MSEEAIALLTEIRDLLRRQEKQAPQSVTLTEFCKRLGRTVWWGYEMIKVGRIIPDKTGKRPYMVPLAQLDNFK